MGYLIGADVGTTGTKTVIIDESGKILSAATVEHPSYHPHPGWSEQDPHDWWDSTVSSIRRAIHKASISGKEVSGIGLSGQMHGSVFLDSNDKVLRPAILWNDQRTGEECDEITERIGAERLIELVCNPALTGFTAPKILWFRKHEPHLYERTTKVLLPKDYVRFRLTGQYATEVSDASGTLLFDVKNRTWSKTLLSELEIDESLMPACYESPEVSGRLTRQAGEALGIPEGVPVVGGGGDQAAGAVGNGIVTTGVISATLGTSGVVFAFSDTVQTDPLGRAHTFCHAVPEKWHIMGVMLSAGGSFRWLRDNLGELERMLAEERGVDPYEILCEEASKSKPGAEGLLFLPYLTGERTPHADPDARGAWVGITARTTKADLIRAVLEGVSYGMRDSLEIIKAMGIPVVQIRASGGGARSELWRQILADIFDHPVVTINAEEGPAFGVALLAGVGTGVWSSVEQACQATIYVVSETEVNSENASLYEKYYPLYQQLYRSLKDDFRTIASIVKGA